MIRAHGGAQTQIAMFRGGRRCSRFWRELKVTRAKILFGQVPLTVLWVNIWVLVRS